MQATITLTIFSSKDERPRRTGADDPLITSSNRHWLGKLELTSSCEHTSPSSMPEIELSNSSDERERKGGFYVIVFLGNNNENFPSFHACECVR